MNTIKLSDINLHDIGNEIQVVGTIWGGKGLSFITPGPNSVETFDNIQLMKLTLAEWETLLRQADLVETEMIQKDPTGKITKILLRKTQRQIDTALQWAIFKRDNYTCRYCGREGVPLTVDHIDLWEEGGATILINLISACRKCNKDRGRMHYEDWIVSQVYRQKSTGLSEQTKQINLDVVHMLPDLRTKRVQNIRSR